MDRNISALESYNIIIKSLSARRAWIEIIDYIIDYATDAVALRKESVDRNSLGAKADSVSKCRSPQGERG